MGNHRLRRLDDERLAALVRAGDAAAFEALYDRHHASLLVFCRRTLRSREDGEDALQQTLIRAHRALRDGRPPDSVRPWLFAIARNRCRTMLAARRDDALPSDAIEPAFDGLADDVRRRADLRQLVTDLGGLPEDQRGALVLSELGDLSHREIAVVIGCRTEKVKALVFQARSALIAERRARDSAYRIAVPTPKNGAPCSPTPSRPSPSSRRASSSTTGTPGSERTSRTGPRTRSCSASAPRLTAARGPSS